MVLNIHNTAYSTTPFIDTGVCFDELAGEVDTSQFSLQIPLKGFLGCLCLTETPRMECSGEEEDQSASEIQGQAKRESWKDPRGGDCGTSFHRWRN